MGQRVAHQQIRNQKQICCIPFFLSLYHMIGTCTDANVQAHGNFKAANSKDQLILLKLAWGQQG